VTFGWVKISWDTKIINYKRKKLINIIKIKNACTLIKTVLKYRATDWAKILAKHILIKHLYLEYEELSQHSSGKINNPVF